MSQNAAPAKLIRKDQSDEDVQDWLKELRQKAYLQPKSNFTVAAVFRVQVGDKEYFVGGANVENQVMSVGSCAEESAMSIIATAFGDKARITEGWVLGAPDGAKKGDAGADEPCTPCGECRQRLAHFADEEVKIHSLSLDGTKLESSVGELLPHAFSVASLPSDILHKSKADAPEEPRDIVKNEKSEIKPKIYDCKMKGWANKLSSDAQMKGIDRVAIVKLTNGASVAGVSIENAAYPSSTSAMQSAVSNAIMAYGPEIKIESAFSYVNDRNASKQAGDSKSHVARTQGAGKANNDMSHYDTQILSEHATPKLSLQLMGSGGRTA
jgi:cytidine deaminase